MIKRFWEYWDMPFSSFFREFQYPPLPLKESWKLARRDPVFVFLWIVFFGMILACIIWGK